VDLRPKAAALAVTLDPGQLDAVLFDLDGVLTATAHIHARCWKRMFDEYLSERAARTGAPFEPFDSERDYLPYVDGKPRYDGVRSFLASRGVELPWGDPADAPGNETVCGLGNRKNALFNEVLREEPPEVFERAVQYVRSLRDRGIKIGVVTASKNATTVLRAAGIQELFDVQMDGVVAAELELAGKPQPDTFVEAARQLGVEPSRAAVVEDAIAGVQAGRAGGFGLVIGVDRTGNAEALKANGADIVVPDVGDLLAV
jgi:alpha,alpha-trehalase